MSENVQNMWKVIKFTMIAMETFRIEQPAGGQTLLHSHT